MDSIIAAKSPLSVLALQALHSTTVAVGSNVQSHTTGGATRRTHHGSLIGMRTEVTPRSLF
jgi:hypothetical protein